MSGFPQSSWTPGALLQNFRQYQFGSYQFPLTFQQRNHNVKQLFDRRKVSMNYGEYIDPAVTIAGRDIAIGGDIGSLVYGASGSQLFTNDDLELERSIIAGLQLQGKQPLWSRPDRYLIATMTEFDFKFMPDAFAHRVATWELKFVADDPRYYSTFQNTVSGGPYTDTAAHTLAVSHQGNTRAFPFITLTGACTHPTIAISNPSPAHLIGVTFSGLTMGAGDTLVVKCDPRPEYRNTVATYTTGGVSTNALKYMNPSTDFANSWDARFFFPFIETSLYGGYLSQVFSAQSTVAGNFTASLSWNDTWI